MELTIGPSPNSWEFYQAIATWDTFIMLERASCTAYTNNRNMKLAETYLDTFSNKSTLKPNDVSTSIIVCSPP